MFLLFSSLALSGANLLPDGGFELGGRDRRVSGLKIRTASLPESVHRK